MLEVVDYTSRRGVIVPLLPQIYALLAEVARKDTLAGLPAPENIVLWKQTMRRILVDIQRHWLFVLDNGNLAGLMFFRIDGTAIYIEELQALWTHRYKTEIISLLLDKFLRDNAVKACNKVFAGERIKNDSSVEILASVGLGEKPPGGYRELGRPDKAAAELRLCYGVSGRG